MTAQLLESVAIKQVAATTTYTSPKDLVNKGCRGVVVTLDMTNVGTGSVTLSVQGKDRASGQYYTLLTGAAVVTNVTNRYTVYPGIPVVANVTAADALPELWRIQVVANNANATTYTVGAVTVP
jgi:hypothetical protein